LKLSGKWAGGNSLDFFEDAKEGDNFLGWVVDREIFEAK